MWALRQVCGCLRGVRVSLTVGGFPGPLSPGSPLRWRVSRSFARVPGGVCFSPLHSEGPFSALDAGPLPDAGRADASSRPGLLVNPLVSRCQSSSAPAGAARRAPFSPRTGLCWQARGLPARPRGPKTPSCCLEVAAQFAAPEQLSFQCLRGGTPWLCTVVSGGRHRPQHQGARGPRAAQGGGTEGRDPRRSLCRAHETAR